jgi:hypothetical protein
LPHMHPWYSCKQSFGCPPMLVLCTWFHKRCWGASHDASWCMLG